MIYLFMRFKFVLQVHTTVIGEILGRRNGDVYRAWHVDEIKHVGRQIFKEERKSKPFHSSLALK